MSNAGQNSRKPHLTVRTRDAQQNHSVISRLQGLFPTSPNALPTGGLPSSANDSDSIMRMAQSARLPKFLKVRILTWNMHDSVPKVGQLAISRFAKALIIAGGLGRAFPICSILYPTDPFFFLFATTPSIQPKCRSPVSCHSRVSLFRSGYGSGILKSEL